MVSLQNTTNSITIKAIHISTYIMHYTTYYGKKPITENMLGGVCWWVFFVCSEMFSNKSTIFVIEESRK